MASPDPAAATTLQPTAQGVCSGWQRSSQWRCILRGLAYDALQASKLSPADQSRLGEALLSAAQPKRVDADDELR
jgi:hypothetical protein